ncbi:UDP-3-O-(3-hydroxymyristoyl)glucosamine N-acyltransferase [Thermocoleostomius sinensis]|uniref:UDP-3-O-acylglucosamine N-acyltransferase n=1 Tax=Thermocoleostomius sinensis A174 TaxID=2016057 RepID=A0A9E9C310_9CYAN|nr:UDP-3-O-(3-hydroxymyristoyl)glucosamine N-acyltransferase [Thermocoleostomius sinensis]WAL58471.1 UDP-3-O-(3-hydroxymyristoyl)glucosamine N-acyltransferase [Thermocoleostomius sinensis A174]
MKFSELLQQLGIDHHHSLGVKPGCNPEITGIAQVQQARSGSLAYIDGGKFASTIETTGASALILPLDETLQAKATERQIAWMSTPDPKLLFAKAVPLFYQPYRPAIGIHPTAIIDPSVRLGQNVSIGAYTVIQADVTIGDGVCIHPQVVIYPQVQIGDRTILHANCTIHERTQIGADCVIHSGAVIGAEGFGFVPSADGWVKMEQSGVTVLEDRVEVGCNTTIDRPAVGETRIGHNSKLDNLVHVGHNGQTGENCIMAAQVGLAGGVQVGNWVILGGQVGVANQTRIGDRVQAGAKAGLHGTIEPGSVMMGNPASPYKTFLKASAVYNRLPEMHQSLRQLQQQMSVLQEQIQAIEAVMVVEGLEQENEGTHGTGIQ